MEVDLIRETIAEIREALHCASNLDSESKELREFILRLSHKCCDCVEVIMRRADKGDNRVKRIHS